MMSDFRVNPLSDMQNRLHTLCHHINDVFYYLQCLHPSSRSCSFSSISSSSSSSCFSLNRLPPSPFPPGGGYKPVLHDPYLPAPPMLYPIHASAKTLQEYYYKTDHCLFMVVSYVDQLMRVIQRFQETLTETERQLHEQKTKKEDKKNSKRVLAMMMMMTTTKSDKKKKNEHKKKQQITTAEQIDAEFWEAENGLRFLEEMLKIDSTRTSSSNTGYDGQGGDDVKGEVFRYSSCTCTASFFQE